MNKEFRSIQIDPIDFPVVTPGADAQPQRDRLQLCREAMPLYIRRIYILSYRVHQGSEEYGKQPMPQWDGGEDQFGRRHNAIWPKIARRIVELGADPVAFVQAQFWAQKDGRPPAPTYLLSTEAATRYQKFQQEAREEVRRSYDADLFSVKRFFLPIMQRLNWDQARATRYALFNVTQVFATALFRYCLATSEGLTDVAEYFHNTALLQYVFQREIYDAAWGDKIPAGLRHEGDDLRARIMGRY